MATKSITDLIQTTKYKNNVMQIENHIQNVTISIQTQGEIKQKDNALFPYYLFHFHSYIKQPPFHIVNQIVEFIAIPVELRGRLNNNGATLSHYWKGLTTDPKPFFSLSPYSLRPRRSATFIYK